MGTKSYSIVEYYSQQKNYKCGYCKNPNSSFSYGMWAHTLSVQDYQNLIDRGWRRSGSYCYKPMMDQTCCPAYTIRCETLDFRISKSQKKILKRMANFLKNKVHKCEEVSNTNIQVDHDDKLDIGIVELPNYKQYAMQADVNASKITVSSVSCEANERLQAENSKQNFSQVKDRSGESVFTDFATTSLKNENSSILEDTRQQGEGAIELNSNQIPLKKAKLLRLERKQNKLLSQGKSMSEVEAVLKEHKQQQTYSKTLEELFSEINSESSKLEFKLVRVMSDEFLNTLDESTNLYKKYQMTIHNDESEECDKTSFLNFLVKSPLKKYCPEDGPEQGYGSFHQQYWLNGQLIAVGVIDILPTCISSVYFFYDPAYSFLSLGTFSSLHEVFLTRQLSRTVPNIENYYMGFYIHSCSKMRYKAKMTPSKLLCPETYTWSEVEKCLPKLDVHKYCRLSEDVDAIDEEGIIKIEEVLVLYRERVMPYRMYKRRVCLSSDESEVREYASLVGMKCATSILLYRNCAL